MAPPLRFTIAVPIYNPGWVLQRALDSLLSQNYPDLEIIVADKESTDCSAWILGAYGDRIRILRRADRGQADALNHAFRAATGDIFGWLCADDELIAGALEHVARIFARDAAAGAVLGACERVFDGQFRAYVQPPADPWKLITVRNVVDQPSMFWRSELHRRIGELDASFDLAFDWDFWCRMRAAGARVRVTGRALSRYHFTACSKTNTAGRLHVDEGFRIIRKYGPRGGAVAYAYRFLYEHFDVKGCLDRPPACSRARRAAFQAARLTLSAVFGPWLISQYNWQFASVQERKLERWGDGRPSPEAAARTMNEPEDWWGSVALAEGDESLPDDLTAPNIALNRRRLARFLEEFAADGDVRDFEAFDALAAAASLGWTALCLPDIDSALNLRPYRLWEFVWLFKTLAMRKGGWRTLVLGGANSHLPYLAAAAGNEVVVLDDDPRAVDAARLAAETLAVKIDVRRGGLDSADLNDGSFDRVLAPSFMEHHTAAAQSRIADRIADLLRPGGIAGFTFDYGPPAPACIHLPPPHDPPPGSREIASRFVRAGLAVAGSLPEEPVAGALFRDGAARCVIASLFLAKAPAGGVAAPRCEPGLPSLMSAIRTDKLLSRVQYAARARAIRRNREEEEKRMWVSHLNSLKEQIAILEGVAKERLELIERIHAEAAKLREQLGQAQRAARR